MDALEFAKQKRRMCKSSKGCYGCPLERGTCSISGYSSTEDRDKEIIAIVEKWAAEHPEKTRQSAFLEMFPNAKLDEQGALIIPPCHVDISYGRDENKKNCCIGKSCHDCRREFWSTPLEEE